MAEVEPIGNKFRIVRESGYKTSYFSFYVDGDKSSWSQHEFNAQTYATKEEAEDGLRRIREREKFRRKSVALRSKE